MSSTAMHMSPSTECSQCLDPDHDGYNPTNDIQQPGDICAIHESPSAPVRLATDKTPYTGTPAPGQGPRPAVLLRPAPHIPRPCAAGRTQSSKSRICLCATFNHEGEKEKLPRISQFFCLPISPHNELSAHQLLPPHFHTRPEWPQRDTWLLAYSFESSGTITGRWQNKGPPPPQHQPSSYRLDGDDLAALVDMCEKKREEWDLLVQEQPELAKEYYREYQRENKRVWKERQSRTTSATSSRITLSLVQNSPAPSNSGLPSPVSAPSSHAASSENDSAVSGISTQASTAAAVPSELDSGLGFSSNAGLASMTRVGAELEAGAMDVDTIAAQVQADSPVPMA
ncbi:hypothetical protein C8Q77DRAFT_1140664 [Trametes polyzona]|nr:hypothetical protein C8Q77DRAFT_1140664 [Trametes polyzona]